MIQCQRIAARRTVPHLLSDHRRWRQSTFALRMISNHLHMVSQVGMKLNLEE